MEYLFLWMIFGIGTSIIASNKGYDGCSYFILGVLLGPIGLLIAIFSSAKPKPASQVALKAKCNFCGFDKGTEALFCPGCGKDKNGLDQAHYQRMASDSSYKYAFEAEEKEKIRKIEQVEIRHNIRIGKYFLIFLAIIGVVFAGYHVIKLVSISFEGRKNLKSSEYLFNEKNFHEANALTQFKALYEDLILFKDDKSFHQNEFSVSPYLEWDDAFTRLKQDIDKYIYLISRDVNIDDLRVIALVYSKTKGEENKLTREIRNHFDRIISTEAPLTVTKIAEGKPDHQLVSDPVYLDLRNSTQFIGAWVISVAPINQSYTFEIYKSGDKYTGVRIHTSSHAFEKLEKKNDRYYIKGSKSGEFYTIDPNHSLGIWDKEGSLYSAGWQSSLIRVPE